MEYTSKIEEMLNDKLTYTAVKTNPVKKLEVSLNSTIKYWQFKNYILKETAVMC